ncbi:MAG: autotransporter-associated beta strand repeat-containing protein, partial [Thermoguttaceae bacterium]|nr:autotransporter-associated beta strand repeat-containing protein [Thermoguttaceae bacterium]
WNKNMTYTGALTGSGKLEVLSDSGWVIMGTTSDDTFTGDVQCNWGSTSSMGKMRLAAEQPFGANAGTGYFYGQLDMNGYSQAFKGLYSNTDGSTLKGQIFNNTDKLSTLTLNITGKDLTYQGKIDGNIELIVNADGEGKQTLNNNASTFTGNIVINGGTLVTTKSHTGTTSALGAISTEGGRTITVNAGAELSFGVNDTLGGCDSTNTYDDNRVTLIINGGKLSGTGNNALYNATFQNGAELYSNDCRDVWRSFWFKGTTNVSFAGDGSAAEKPVNFNGVPEAIVVPDNAVFNVDDITKNTASDLIVNVTMGNKSSGLITTNSLTKTGAGTMELTSANSYDGGTAVSGGTLKLTGAGTLGTGAVAVNDAGTLEVAYEDPAKDLDISSLTLAEGGTFKLTSGTASIDEALTAEAGAQFIFELGGTADSSLLLSSGSTMDISENAVLELLMLDGASGTYTLIEAEDGLGDYTDAAFWTDLLTTESDYFWDLSIVGNSLLATVDSNAVPEPATWALLIFGAFGVYWVRRKK